MLSFNALGQLGRLGNQMFQYAALFALARRRGFDFVVPPSSARDLRRDHQLFAAFQLPGARCAGMTRNVQTVQPRGFNYDAVFAEHCPDNVDLHGYFQTEKYFADAADAVRGEFAFHPATVVEAEQRLASISEPRLSVHVRRGDYVDQANFHPPCEVGYYAAALARMPPQWRVILFSDDIAWCRDQEVFAGERFVFSDGASNVTDLCMMSLCDHHIIANSSFSWWGAWLGRNPEKRVTAPDRWFGPSYARLDTRDLLPGDWLTIE